MTTLQEAPGTDARPADAGASGVRIAAVKPTGPIFTGRAPLRRTQPETFVPVLPRRARLVVAAFSLAWLVSFTSFWLWWLAPGHLTHLAGGVINSLLLLYLTAHPSSFVISANRLVEVNPRLPILRLRVAFAVTKAPAEPWPVALRTLRAMLEQHYPYEYDVWLCDERPSAETLRWCAQHGVRVSTREHAPGYHRADYPRRTRCKEGNLAYFYDHWGYDEYDVVVQMDCDHVPGRRYLAEMVRPFADPAIGYVAAPSVCDRTAGGSWAARGRLHRESVFHGAYQLGHHRGFAPVCIGSHYAVRTGALREIGGLGPELAEDFSTTFLLVSAGWQGAFALRARARGDGPLTFAAMVTQEFQWSRSMVTLLLTMAPRHLARMPLAVALRFLYALTFYPFLMLAMVGGLCLPAVAAVTGAHWVNVSVGEFLWRWALVEIAPVGIMIVLRWHNLLRPRTAPLLSWEDLLYILSRWVYVARGVAAAVVQAVSPRQVAFRVTPKSLAGIEPFPLALSAPYAVLAAALAGAGWLGLDRPFSYGYVLLCLWTAALLAVVALAIPLLHVREAARVAGTTARVALRACAGPAVLVGALAWLPLLACLPRLPEYLAIALGP